mgnify:CR=1 FL=1
MTRARGLDGVPQLRTERKASSVVQTMQGSGSTGQAVHVDDVAANPRNPQARAVNIADLVPSVSEVGVMVPILLTPVGEWLEAHPEDAEPSGERDGVMLAYPDPSLPATGVPDFDPRNTPGELLDGRYRLDEPLSRRGSTVTCTRRVDGGVPRASMMRRRGRGEGTPAPTGQVTGRVAQ